MMISPCWPQGFELERRKARRVNEVEDRIDLNLYAAESIA
jgi:hypothetical protein